MLEELSTEQLTGRGRKAFAAGDYALALAHFREAARREPRFADVQHQIGLCLGLLGRPEEAIEAFDRALAVNPRYVEAHVNRAIILQEIGRYEEASRSFDAATEAEVEEGVGSIPGVLATRLAKLHMELGDLYAEAGAAAEAVEQYRSASRLRPRFADIHNKFACVLMETGDMAGAVRELREALDINPNFLAARINLGLARYREGNLDAARREWEACDRQQPGQAQVALYLAMLES